MPIFTMSIHFNSTLHFYLQKEAIIFFTTILDLFQKLRNELVTILFDDGAEFITFLGLCRELKLSFAGFSGDIGDWIAKARDVYWKPH